MTHSLNRMANKFVICCMWRQKPTPSSLSSVTTVLLSEGGCWALMRSTSAWFCELWSRERGKALHEPSSFCTPSTARQSPVFATWMPSMPTWATQAVQPANATWTDNACVSTLYELKTH